MPPNFADAARHLTYSLVLLAVIFNPAAGRGRVSRAQLKARLSHHAAGAPFRVWATQNADDAALLAARALDEGAQIVAAAGGDGTLGEVAGVVHKRGAVLGVLPLGTGNDFARALGVGTDLDRAIETLFRGQKRTVDGALATLGERTWFWINIAGCGFDALVARRINAARFHPFWKHCKGDVAYVAAVALELRTLRAANLRLILDGQTIERRAILCAIANATSYGGGMKVAPDARLDDGLFDICLIKEASVGEFVRAFPSVFRGEHLNHPKVEMFRARRVEVASEMALPVLVDGEVRGQTPVVLEIVPAALQIRTPQKIVAGG